MIETLFCIHPVAQCAGRTAVDRDQPSVGAFSILSQGRWDGIPEAAFDADPACWQTSGCQMMVSLSFEYLDFLSHEDVLFKAVAGQPIDALHHNTFPVRMFLDITGHERT